ncbi:ABC transporter substrate-binding protein [Desulfonema magnum]|uniref:NMT1/THI5 like domain-containing protein n=1 Tax=Desulfonema magnum TaxID=45655 RepID=A0A975BVM3_9BACT|nr:ABC transporter substrate-binding protein [Desulfonema magnum]QTA92468.1 NMT1/THI5 like domain-containing protein [Desulfonema magnum]
MSKRPFIIALVVTLMAIIGAGIWSAWKSLRKPVGPLEKATIGIIHLSFTGYPVYVALEKDYFKDQGLDIALQYYPYGNLVLDAVIRGKADFGISSETPFMHTVLNGGKIYAFATTMTAKKHLAIVARKDRGILTPNDLKGKKIGVTTGTNGEYFLDTVLLLHNISRNDINIVHLKPEQMVDTLMSGEADAIATWNPLMCKARKMLGQGGSVFYAKGLYSPFFAVSARHDYVHNNPQIIEKVVRSLIRSCEFIQNNSDKSREIAARYLRTDPSLLNELTATYHFKISLDQSFLMTLEDQSEWAIKNNLTECTTVPNYLNFIYTDALKNAEPANMTIIK